MLEHSLRSDLDQILNEFSVELSWFDPFLNPRVIQSLICSQPSFQTWMEQPFYEVPHFTAEAKPILLIKGIVTATNL
jgi:hypothetical protein